MLQGLAESEYGGKTLTIICVNVAVGLVCNLWAVESKEEEVMVVFFVCQ